MARKSSANLALTLGAWKTRVRLYRVETGADTPTETLTHTCRHEISVEDSCATCGTVLRQAAPQKSGKAKGKPGTAKLPKVCPTCQTMGVPVEVKRCEACDRQIDDNEIENRLALAAHTVKVDAALLEEWRGLLPPSGTMRVESAKLRNELGTYLFDEAYQLVPDKGSVLSFAALMEYLLETRGALIVHFLLQKTFKIGAVYVSHVRGTPILLLHTLLGLDEIQIMPFDVPEMDRPSVKRDIHELLRPAWNTPLEQAVKHPQRGAFEDLFRAAQEGGKLEIRKLSVLPGELAVLSSELDKSLNPPKKGKGKKEVEDDDSED